MNCDTVDMKPRDFNFGSGYTETWDRVQPDFSRLDENECREVLDGYGIELDELDEDEDKRTYQMVEAIEEYAPDAWCPMMNYWYPIPQMDTGEAAYAQAELELASLPVCVVQMGEEFGLALTGGGMDLSWEICEGFIKIGYRPPVHFCDLPKMAGRGESERDLAIIKACKESCEIAARWSEGKISRLQEMGG